MYPIIAVDEADVRADGQIQPCVSGRGKPLVVLVDCHDSTVGQRQRITKCTRSVRRSVVNEDELEIRVGLNEYRGDALRYIFLNVEYRHDDTDFRLHYRPIDRCLASVKRGDISDYHFEVGPERRRQRVRARRASCRCRTQPRRFRPTFACLSLARYDDTLPPISFCRGGLTPSISVPSLCLAGAHILGKRVVTSVGQDEVHKEAMVCASPGRPIERSPTAGNHSVRRP